MVKLTTATFCLTGFVFFIFLGVSSVFDQTPFDPPAVLLEPQASLMASRYGPSWYDN